MGLAGASAGALSGVVVSAWEYSGLAWVAALATVPLILLVAGQRWWATRPEEGTDVAR
jgi:predicted MFS family arabinose efflux permease